MKKDREKGFEADEKRKENDCRQKTAAVPSPSEGQSRREMSQKLFLFVDSLAATSFAGVHSELYAPIVVLLRIV